MTVLHPTWQQALSNAVTSYDELCSILHIAHKTSTSIQVAQSAFSLRVPREFVARMEKGNPNDPLLLQVLPQALEMKKMPGFSIDPLQEKQSNPVPGLLHKYPNRVLLTLAGVCAINCRYCFRRHFPYEDNVNRAHWKKALDYIAENNAIDEVILSGGDPLVLKDPVIAELVFQLEKMAHVKRLRIHTRLPIVIPQRVTQEWLAWLKKTRFQTIVVLHCNHVNEIDESVVKAIQKLRSVTTVLNQSVLLKNINDSAEALIALSQRLFEAGALPYYLHLLDKVEGAAHFDVSEEKANALMRILKESLPGFLVPKLAKEVSGLPHKQF